MTTIGFIGLGSMGGPMAGRLADAGHAPAVFDIERCAVDAVVARGGSACASAREVAERADIVFCCLPAPEVSVAVAHELRAGRRCRLLVEMSTVGRAALKEIARAAGDGIQLLDCPTSGGVPKARSGELAAIVAGPQALVARRQGAGTGRIRHRP
jgi:3-hydroxyisobutyrate dehydrogenase-like beta-hydroxyacid dehydrogenase